jgi:hypothetical protein
VVYMGVAADCNYISTYGGTEQARTQILTNWNRFVLFTSSKRTIADKTILPQHHGSLPFHVQRLARHYRAQRHERDVSFLISSCQLLDRLEHALFGFHYVERSTKSFQ